MSFIKSEIRKTLIQKLNDALVAEIPGLTRRLCRPKTGVLPDAPLPRLPRALLGPK